MGEGEEGGDSFAHCEGGGNTRAGGGRNLPRPAATWEGGNIFQCYHWYNFGARSNHLHPSVWGVLVA